MTNPETLLEVKYLSKYFGGLKALDRVDLSVNPGEILGLIGPNGAGKTTLFSVIAGSLRPEKGKIIFKGKNIAGYRPHVVCKRGIARTFQVPKPFLNLSVFENVLVGASFGSGTVGREKAIGKVWEILNLSGLEQKALLPAGSLNLVERKKLEVAKALSTSPELILLDEVIAGLNPTEVHEMIQFISNLRDMGMTIILIEHVMKVIMTLSDRIVVLQYGQKLCEGTPDHVANHPEVIEAYLGATASA